jgi:hypothetical protein
VEVRLFVELPTAADLKEAKEMEIVMCRLPEG